MGRSRSRSRSRDRYRSYSRSYSRSNSRSPSPDDENRIHVADLGIDPSRSELVRSFERFGRIVDMWLARNPPCFAFIVYRYRDEAEKAIREMDGKAMCGGRIRVSFARPRTRGRRRRGFDPNLRCYQCGEKGHFSRDCAEVWRNRRQDRSRSRSRSHGRNSRRRSRRSQSRSRSRSHSKNHSRSRSRSASRSKSSRKKSSSDSKHRSKHSPKSKSPKKSKSKERKSEKKSSKEKEIESENHEDASQSPKRVACDSPGRGSSNTPVREANGEVNLSQADEPSSETKHASDDSWAALPDSNEAAREETKPEGAAETDQRDGKWIDSPPKMILFPIEGRWADTPSPVAQADPVVCGGGGDD